MIEQSSNREKLFVSKKKREKLDRKKHNNSFYPKKNPQKSTIANEMNSAKLTAYLWKDELVRQA